MRRMVRTISSIALAMLLSLFATTTALASSWTREEIVSGCETSVFVNGEEFVNRVNVDKDGELSFQLRAFMESIGYTVNWLAENRSIEMINGYNRILAFADSSLCEMNGLELELGKPVYIDNNASFFPQSFLSAALNMEVISTEIIGGHRTENIRISSLAVEPNKPIERTAPLIKSIDFLDKDNKPLPITHNWINLQAISKINVAYEGEATHIDFYSTPTGTETIYLQKLIGFVDVRKDDRIGQFEWEVPDGFMGHIWVLVYNGDVARKSDLINAIYE